MKSRDAGERRGFPSERTVVLVEDQYQSFRERDDEPPYMETRRLLQVSLTRARHFAFILSGTKNATLDVILAG